MSGKEFILSKLFIIAVFSLVSTPFFMAHRSQVHIVDLFKSLLHPANWAVYYLIFLPSILLREITSESIAVGLITSLVVNATSRRDDKFHVSIHVYITSILLVIFAVVME
jgi:hypothetical protein